MGTIVITNKNFLGTGNKISFIKALRHAFGLSTLSLKEAKALVDSFDIHLEQHKEIQLSSTAPCQMEYFYQVVGDYAKVYNQKSNTSSKQLLKDLIKTTIDNGEYQLSKELLQVLILNFK